ncbi:MAG: hypothetical protein AAFV85_25140 [Cyanobacteria bacterium J06634_6]
MNSQVDNRAQLIESIIALPEESLAELSSFVSYLRYKAVESTLPKAHNSFLLSVAGLGESEETDVSERDEEILSKEIDPIKGWSLHTEESA